MFQLLVGPFRYSLLGVARVIVMAMRGGGAVIEGVNYFCTGEEGERQETRSV